MSFKVDNIVAKFQVKVLLPITGEPNYGEINKINKFFYGSATNLPTTPSGGRHRHTGLRIDPTLYSMTAHTAYADLDGP